MSNRALIITTALLIDAAVMVLVLKTVIQKRGLSQLFSVGLEKSKELAAESRELCGNYLRANYSGNPDDLAPLLEQLLTQLDQKAKERGITLNREMLKLVLANSLRAEDGVPVNDIQNALRKVA